jgi:hypothetical protein
MTGIRRCVLYGALLALYSAAAGAQTSPDMPSMPLNPLRSIEKSSLVGFRQRPLFNPSREEPPEPAAAPVIAAPPPATLAPPAPPPHLSLIGIIHGDHDIAVVRVNGAPGTTLLATGDHVGDWAVTIVPPLGLRLKDGERILDFGLFVHDPAAPASTPSPRTVQ